MAGTLAEWQHKVAACAVGNSRLALFLSAAFAGPLLDIVGEQSGGIHLVGKAQSGKSTAAYIAGSVWGRGDREGQIRAWRGTANGLEGVASETSDTVLILDEMGQADSREVGEITYMLANNSGKMRAGRTGNARARKTWRVLFLSTGEVTLAAKMGEAGKRIMAGQEVRLVNIPADAGAGMVHSRICTIWNQAGHWPTTYVTPHAPATARPHGLSCPVWCMTGHMMPKGWKNASRLSADSLRPASCHPRLMARCGAWPPVLP